MRLVLCLMLCVSLAACGVKHNLYHPTQKQLKAEEERRQQREAEEANPTPKDPDAEISIWPWKD